MINFDNFIDTGFTNQIGYVSYNNTNDLYIVEWLDENIGAENYELNIQNITSGVCYFLIDLINGSTYIMLKTIIEMNRDD